MRIHSTHHLRRSVRLRVAALAIGVLGGALAAPGQPQQFRAAWVDVFHEGMRSAAQVDTMISKLVTGRYNAVIVQVLAYMDNASPTRGAYWKSSILPWSGYVTAGFDPLAYVCQKAHTNGIEVHAWLGGSGGAMYRVSTAWPPAGNATLAAHPEWFMVPRANSEGNAVVAINGNYLLDMGSSDVQEYLVSIVRELVSNYPIDGIHWDDEHGSAEYNAGLGFPAYSTTIYPNSGLARYRRNTGYVGTPSATDATYGNYRRRFKNELIARCQAEIQAIKTNPRQPLRHTAATMAYGGPPGTCTFTSEEAYLYYSDWPTMLQNGWLDAAIPMNYKAETNYPTMYRDWCDRAYACWRYNRHIYMGLGAYMNTRSNTVVQLKYAYNAGLNGGVTYSYAVPYASGYDSGDWWTYVATNYYTNTATIPTMPWRNPATATEGILWGRVRDASTGNSVDDATVTVTGSGRPAVKTDGNGYYVATLIPATSNGTTYSVTVTKTNMAPQTITNAVVLAGDIVRYDLFLNPPATPTGLTATAVSGTQINLTWTDNATNETGYVVARGTSSGGPFTNIAALPANTTRYTNSALLPGSTFCYVVRATNTYTASADSTPACATTPTPPSITGQPQSRTNLAGTDASFWVTATGTAPLSYQWRFNTANIPGATASSYTRTNVQSADAGDYSAVVSNAAGVVTSSNATLTVLVPPYITAQPQSRTNLAGTDASFWVTASGTPAPAYQWRFNGTDIAGATASGYTRTSVQPADAGEYTVVVTNAAGAVTSAPALLTVIALVPPYIETITRLEDGRIWLVVTGSPGNYVIEGSTNLAGWSDLTNLSVATNRFEYFDAETNLWQRFYRTRQTQ